MASISPPTGRSRARPTSVMPRPWTVVVRIAEDQAWRIADVYGRAALDCGRTARRAGSRRLAAARLTVSWPDEVATRLLAIGPSLEVLGPADVRERVIATAGRVVERYRDSTPVDAGR